MGAHVSTTGSLLFKGLPVSERILFEPDLEPFAMNLDELICAPDALITHAVFPRSGLISLFARTREGSVMYGGFIGRESMFGLALSVGTLTSAVEARVQGAGSAIRIETHRFRKLLRLCPFLSWRVHRSTIRQLDDVTQMGVCNGHHSVEARTARWILLTGRRMNSNAFDLKQSALANMLGVLRPSVSHAAMSLSRRGLVEYRRGKMRILDEPGLVARACSCYPIAVDAYSASLL